MEGYKKMIKVLDVNNNHNTAIFKGHEYQLACEYFDMLTSRYNDMPCNIILSIDGKVDKFLIK